MKTELLELRKRMTEKGIDYYIVPSGDYHGSEYLNDFFKTRKYVSGFTGSAGTLLVTQDEAKLWTDGRYFIQAEKELEGSGIDLMKMLEPGVPSIEEELDRILSSDSSSDAAQSEKKKVLGFDGMILDNRRGKAFQEIADKYDVSIDFDNDLVGDIWEDRPSLNGSSIWNLPLSSAGIDYSAKISQVRALMDEAGATHHFITGLAENAWLYNLRGRDVSYTPVFFSFTLISPEEVTLYLLPGTYDECEIPEGVNVRNYFIAKDDIKDLPKDSVLLMDPGSVSYAFFKCVPDNIKILEQLSPITRLKAIKNPVEIESTINAHTKDGVAMVNFIYWLKQFMKGCADGKYSAAPTEIFASDYLESKRREQDGFIELSFDTISGYMDHGAIIHYSATQATDKELKPEGFLLIDSGGQYIDGTTDITRTVALGPLTDKMIECYTAVLKGHIALATSAFTDGFTGAELDQITRAPLKEKGLDYKHGTGHGVGHVLCVHEGPNSISEVGGKDQPIIPGMITSNEPGVYFEGEFGIRIESEILCKLADEQTEDLPAYDFRTITYCPFEPAAINKDALTPEEVDFVNSYHKEVYETLSPHLSPEVAEWLKEECRPL